MNGYGVIGEFLFILLFGLLVLSLLLLLTKSRKGKLGTHALKTALIKI
jgi:hypothetical protein